MSTIRAYLGTAGLTDVGYQFYTQNTGIGSRTETGVTDEGEGYYSVSGVTLQGDHVRWDSTGTSSAKARSDVLLAIAAETVIANLDATISGIAAAILGLTDGVETGVTVKQAMRATLAFVSGKADGGNTTPQHYRDPGDTVDRITMTVDSNGNRSAVTLNL